MQKTKDAAAESLAHKRVAVTGVSGKNAQAHGSNVVYKRLRDCGYEVFAINPHTARTADTDRAAVMVPPPVLC